MSEEIKIGLVVYKKSNLPMSLALLVEMGLSEEEAKRTLFELTLSENVHRGEVAIDQAADEFHAQRVGSRSVEREARRLQNRMSAKRVIADEYGDNTKLKSADLASLNAQAAALAMRTKTPVKSLLDFAKWIDDQEPKSILVQGNIEAFRQTGKAGLSNLGLGNLTDYLMIKPKVDAYLSSLRKSAEKKFEALK